MTQLYGAGILFALAMPFIGLLIQRNTATRGSAVMATQAFRRKSDELAEQTKGLQPLWKLADALRAEQKEIEETAAEIGRQGNALLDDEDRAQKVQQLVEAALERARSLTLAKVARDLAVQFDTVALLGIADHWKDRPSVADRLKQLNAAFAGKETLTRGEMHEHLTPFRHSAEIYLPRNYTEEFNNVISGICDTFGVERGRRSELQSAICAVYNPSAKVSQYQWERAQQVIRETVILSLSARRK